MHASAYAYLLMCVRADMFSLRHTEDLGSPGHFLLQINPETLHNEEGSLLMLDGFGTEMLHNQTNNCIGAQWTLVPPVSCFSKTIQKRFIMRKVSY